MSRIPYVNLQKEGAESDVSLSVTAKSNNMCTSCDLYLVAASDTRNADAFFSRMASSGTAPVCCMLFSLLTITSTSVSCLLTHNQERNESERLRKRFRTPASCWCPHDMRLGDDLRSLTIMSHEAVM